MTSKIIRNEWCQNASGPVTRAKILASDTHPEGLDVERLRFVSAGVFTPNADVGHIVSVLWGQGELSIVGSKADKLRMEQGVHVYLPPGTQCGFHATAHTELLVVSSHSGAQARGEELIVRDEKFLAGCSSHSRSFRWILTAQYLSRRIFLHHDRTLLSKSGNPVSWFRTTMFDIAGLPPNEDGESVFKMAYNSRTEFNVCYDVKGNAHVRMAIHPYRQAHQEWGKWSRLDSETTYHLNEVQGELRNKHEVRIVGGYVTLFCLFDPAPVGIERHREGEYSDYESASMVLGTPDCEHYMREIARYDGAVDVLSRARAQGKIKALEDCPEWKIIQEGRESQKVIELQLSTSLAENCRDRESIIRPWMLC